MRTAPLARQRLVDTAARLFQVQGYHQTGLNQILAESQAPKGSLYHYFPGGKEDLAVAAVETSAAQVSAKLAEVIGKARSPAAALERVLQHFIAELEGSQYEKGCPVATITLEQAAQSARIRSACAAAYARWQADLETFLQQHGVRHAAALAEHFLMLLEGALLLSRARHDCQPLRQLRSSFLE